ncbi:MAG: flagellar basal body rod protein FlgC [Planctomycetes bacterium]|nr:flagellar basal body rod protein FlgC [Planctomycetota bacterium]
MFQAFDISTSGMRAQRTRMTTIASNLANVNTTRNAAGEIEPYRRLITLFEPGADGKDAPGVRVSGIVQQQGPLRRVEAPDHPDAGPDGYVSFPNVDVATEMIDSLEAARAFEANVTAFEATKSMLNNALRILA